MAKVNFGPLANDARGKINGIVYSKNKSGAYTRKKVTPSNPNTPDQSARRNDFSGLSKAWSATLTEVQRQAWINYANTYPRLDIFGASITITGLNMFISLNQVLLNIGQPIILVPPASNLVNPIPFDPTTLVVNAVAHTGVFQQTAAAVDVTDFFYTFGAAPAPAGRQPQSNVFRYIGTLAPVVGPYNAPIDVWTPYIAKFGLPLAGQRVSVLVATVDEATGLTTVGTVMSVIAT